MHDHPPLKLIDSFGRVHNNLRISVTDRCNIRCVYCMPESISFLPRRELLTFEEIERFVRALVPLGINKLRLTGGEPLLRRDLPTLVDKLAKIPGISDVGLTTNGMQLARMAQKLWDAGLRRINVSLDTLTEHRFQEITRRPGLDQVLEGIQAARSAGFDPVKINTVAMKGVTDDEVIPLARYARNHGLELRFIEYMPLDALNQWERDKVLPASEIVRLVESEFGPLTPDPDQDPRAPAQDYVYTDGATVRLGIIASVSRPFCMSCNRVRITADGKLRNCLFAHEETDIRDLIRTGADDEAIRTAVRASVIAKRAGHEINNAGFIKPERLMHSIGG